jgi:N6-adenosine-specific RNA methylase IME4
VWRARLATRAARPYIAVADDDYNAVARVNVWGWPLVSLASWLAVASSVLGRTIVWRGIGYRLNSPQSTTLVGPSADFNRENNSHARAKTRAA